MSKGEPWAAAMGTVPTIVIPARVAAAREEAGICAPPYSLSRRRGCREAAGEGAALPPSMQTDLCARLLRAASSWGNDNRKTRAIAESERCMTEERWSVRFDPLVNLPVPGLFGIPIVCWLIMQFDPNALKAEAVKVTGHFACSEDCSAGGVGAAVLSASGKIFTGICIDTACSLGFCAEHAAIAEMVKDRQTRIVAVVAVNADGAVLAPCGRCRELIHQVDDANWDANIILENGVVVTLRDLLPHR
jgi:cytidine deaminase